jgi:hypothetical protein
MDPATAATVGSITELLRYGIAGVFIIVLLFACWTLWRTNIALTNQIAKIQEERISDVRKQTEAFVTNAASLDKSTTQLANVQNAFTSLVTELQSRRRG